jgi:hypothetical protein
MPVASPLERGSDHKYAVLRNPSVGRFTLRGHPALPLSPPVEQPGSHDSGDNEQGQLPAHVVGLHLKAKQLKIVAGVLGTRITVSHSDLSEQQYIGLAKAARADIYAKANSALKAVSGVLSIDTHG